MKRSVSLWQLWGFAFTSLLGTVLHFLYGWLGDTVWIAPFSSVNESTWEHMKLLFWPMLLFAIFQSFFLKDRPDFWCIKLRGTLLGLCLIPLLFYTYNGVIGPSPDFINIGIFFISGAAVYLYEGWQFKGKIRSCAPQRAIFTFCLIGALFVLFTFMPPALGLFKDPLTEGYGR